jgi:hypothetical protein
MRVETCVATKSKGRIEVRRLGRTTFPRFVSFAHMRQTTLTVLQDRITDHRIPLTISGLADAMEGGETLDMITRELEIKEEQEYVEGL